MKITIIGGGPGGLYLALLTKKARPDWTVEIHEQNRADDTFGFGVVFSDDTLDEFLDRDLPVFERIREELKTARGPSRAIELGYEKALSAILDANITTLITAVILFAMGSGPVRGFAITLGLGIVTSVFTAIYVTRLMIATWYDRRRPKTIEV